jgi:hypothetical protein
MPCSTKHFRFTTGEATMAKSTIAIEPTMKIVAVRGATNPAREGSERHARIDAVLKAKRVELALGRGARTSTVRFCIANELVRVSA